MKNLLNFFFSFDKLMKETLVKAFYWLALIVILMTFFGEALEAIRLGPLAGLVEFFQFFVEILLALVSLRLLCEAAIALFRINDNLAEDGGAAETADIDLLSEARKAAEEATQKARSATNNVMNRGKTATDKAAETVSDVAEDISDTTKEAASSVTEKTESIKEAAKETVTKTKTAAKKATQKTSSGIRLKKDGTPAKKPGPKPKG